MKESIFLQQCNQTIQTIYQTICKSLKTSNRYIWDVKYRITKDNNVISHQCIECEVIYAGKTNNLKMNNHN